MNMKLYIAFFKTYTVNAVVDILAGIGIVTSLIGSFCGNSPAWMILLFVSIVTMVANIFITFKRMRG